MEQNINAVWMRIQNDKSHLKKLKEIKNRPVGSLNSPPEATRYRRHLQLGSIVHERARVKSIIRENRRMIGRLCDAVTDTTIPKRTERKAKSLNCTYNKLESERIRMANHSLANRIEKQNTDFNFKQLQKAYERAENYKKMASKFNRLESIKKLGHKILYLPKQASGNSTELLV